MDSIEKMSSEFTKISKLTGSDNYLSWRRNAKLVLEWHDMDNYLNESSTNAENSAAAASAAAATAAQYAIENADDANAQQAATDAARAAAMAAAQDSITLADRLKKSKQAKARLMMLIDEKLHDEIGEHETAANLWKKCASLYRNDNWLHKARIMGELATLKLANFSSMETFIREHTTAMCRFQEAGFTISDEVVCGLIIFGLTAEYESFVGGLDGSCVLLGNDPTAGRLTSEVLTRRLIDAAQAKKLLNGEENANGAFKASFKPKPVAAKSKQTWETRSGAIKCFTCGEKGHKSFQCKTKAGNDEEDESGSAKPAFYAMAAEASVDTWFIDSGASSHLTSDRQIFKKFSENSNFADIVTADNTRLKVIGSGSIELLVDSRIIPVNDVLLVPDITANLLSVSSMVKAGNSVNFNNNGCVVRSASGDVIVKTAPQNGIYKVTDSKKTSGMLAGSNEDQLMKWHRRLGHLSYGNLVKLNEMIGGISLKGNRDALEKCVPCLMGKQSRRPFRKQDAKIKTKRILELVHSDVCGPMETTSVGGAKYFVTFVDDYSRKVFVYFAKRKNDIEGIFIKFKQFVETQACQKLKVLRSDNGGEYIGEFDAECQRSGILHQTSCAYTPQQNGVAERMNRTLVERARCMLFDANFDKSMWAEAINMAAYVTNRTPNRTLEKRIPETFWSDDAVDYGSMRIFGTAVMVHIPKERRKKWDAKSKELRFVGYSETQKGYRCIDMTTKLVTVSRDVAFLNAPELKSDDAVKVKLDINPFPTETMESNEPSQLKIGSTREETSIQNGEQEISEEDEEYESLSEPDSLSTDKDYEPEVPLSVPVGVEPRRSKRTPKPRDIESMVAFIAEANEPANYNDAVEANDKQHWLTAMKDELGSHDENGTWTLVDLPVGRKTIKTKWVFKLKKDTNGEVVRYKARLVAKGCSQRYGIDYEETFSPVARYGSIRYLLALAAKNGFGINQMDAVTAFLQGDLNEEIYTDQPQGFDDNTGRVCKLNRAMYGLKQAGRQWNIKLDAALTDFGMTRSNLDPCVYHSKENDIILAIYVDDLIILWKSERCLKDIKVALNTRFKMTDLGRATNIVGIAIEYTDGGIAIHQQHYIKSVLERFGMKDAKPAATPSDPSQKLSIAMLNPEEDVDNIPYQEAVGCLLYLVQCTRPDIAFAVSDVSRFNSKYGRVHWTAVKRIMRYLKGTINYCINYRLGGDGLIGFSDADWASDVDKRRSCTGYVFLLGDGAISWASTRQVTVALSSTEAEYMALSTATCEAVWLRMFRQEFEAKQKKVMIKCDNQSAISIAEVEMFRKRSKHIDIRYHHIRDKVNLGVIGLEYVSSMDNLADCLTKGVVGPTIQRGVEGMGIKPKCVT